MHIRLTSKSTLIGIGAAAALMIAPATALASASSQAASPAGVSVSATVNWQITLKPGPAYPRATGSAQYQSQPGQSEFQLEVEGVRSLAGQTVQIYANGSAIGQAKVSSLGIVQFDRNSELGQRVPHIAHGSTVAVRTSTHVVVASGQF
jgi:hypothetical protein